MLNSPPEGSAIIFPATSNVKLPLLTSISLSSTVMLPLEPINAFCFNLILVLVASNSKYALPSTKCCTTVSASADADVASVGQIWVKNETPNCLAFTDDAGTDIVGIGKYHYETKICNFYSSVTSTVYLPIAGYVIERTSTAGQNEFISMIAPFDGTIEKFAFRSEAAQGTGSGTMTFRVLESSDGTEVPGTQIYRKDLSSLSIADDTYTEYDLTLPGIGSYPIPITKGRIYAFAWTPAAIPYDSNTILVFKWDITS